VQRDDMQRSGYVLAQILARGRELEPITPDVLAGPCASSSGIPSRTAAWMTCVLQHALIREAVVARGSALRSGTVTAFSS
jgi:hypothetical protein